MLHRQNQTHTHKHTHTTEYLHAKESTMLHVYIQTNLLAKTTSDN